MMSEYSYFHVSKITVQEVQPSVDKLYAVADDHRKRFRSVQQTQKEESAAIGKEVRTKPGQDSLAPAINFYRTNRPLNAATC